MPTARRDATLTTVAILFAVLAVSDFLKPLQLGAQTGFVFFGRRLGGTANAIIGPLFGFYLLVYAMGIWNRRRWALPMGAAYAAYVVLNLVLFNFRTPQPPGIGYKIFGAVYSLIAIAVSAGSVYLLARRRAALS